MEQTTRFVLDKWIKEMIEVSIKSMSGDEIIAEIHRLSKVSQSCQHGIYKLYVELERRRKIRRSE